MMTAQTPSPSGGRDRETDRLLDLSVRRGAAQPAVKRVNGEGGNPRSTPTPPPKTRWTREEWSSEVRRRARKVVLIELAKLGLIEETAMDESDFPKDETALKILTEEVNIRRLDNEKKIVRKATLELIVTEGVHLQVAIALQPENVITPKNPAEYWEEIIKTIGTNTGPLVKAVFQDLKAIEVNSGIWAVKVQSNINEEAARVPQLRAIVKHLIQIHDRNNASNDPVRVD
jgi:hypothetical protein